MGLGFGSGGSSLRYPEEERFRWRKNRKRVVTLCLSLKPLIFLMVDDDDERERERERERDLFILLEHADGETCYHLLLVVCPICSIKVVGDIFDPSLSYEEREKRKRQAAERAVFLQDLLVSTLLDD
ncbi:hypothetical protein LOK49_LG03G02507 [Camellia lanceoleosa]|uniref:Uncharacterized protein n=1 Tax=Camellia lanceoleosa TaxID=1840588 RepID=A0ACC0I927_9ERIC|nr:hypothetical protein LOK49_LG03G02507 [Camellia lanceoleosa]